jgi:hypothetical protein
MSTNLEEESMMLFEREDQVFLFYHLVSDFLKLETIFPQEMTLEFETELVEEYVPQDCQILSFGHAALEHRPSPKSLEFKSATQTMNEDYQFPSCLFFAEGAEAPQLNLQVSCLQFSF